MKGARWVFSSTDTADYRTESLWMSRRQVFSNDVSNCFAPGQTNDFVRLVSGLSE
jgi:hypothetical protein